MKRKCQVHTAFGNERYFHAVNRFVAHGISYDTVLRPNTNVHSAFPFSGNSQQVDNSQYDFYVAKQDKHRAKQALHS
ncbi:hypothetical protein [Planococcus shixiaomingii]|uniref:hypothetical protein n=1 Tax=Planococcus shixiaomingii TaxID=3058393 RepID=UPI00265984B4|nr:hypothetical protein [Planococcus sp. N028]